MRWYERRIRVGVAAVIVRVMAAAVASAGESPAGCCLPDGSCTTLTSAACTTQNGVPQPGPCNGQSCGACCEIEGATLPCTLQLAANCTAAQERAFAGPGTNCDAGCPFCCACSGGDGCSTACEDNPTRCLCGEGCVLSASLFETCQDSGCATSGCCDVSVREGADQCVESNPALCDVVGGTFHAGEFCKPEIGRCGPKICCHCDGPVDLCGSGECQDDCDAVFCPSTQCLLVVTTSTCAEDCTPTGCCDLGDERFQFCAASDAAACAFGNGAFVEGGTCDPSVGLCTPPTPTVTGTATATSTRTATATASATPVPTATKVPSGGACTDSAECVSGLACINLVCTNVDAVAPATSHLGLLVVLGALMAVAGRALFLRRR